MSFIRSIFDFISFPGRSQWDVSNELLTSRIYRLFVGWKFEKLNAKFSQKNEKSEKFEIFKIFDKFFGELAIKASEFQKKFIAVTRRAGWLILSSKSNTVSGQIVPRRACDKFITFALKCQFLIDLHAFDYCFYFISVRSRWDEWNKLLTFRIYRLFPDCDSKRFFSF